MTETHLRGLRAMLGLVRRRWLAVTVMTKLARAAAVAGLVGVAILVIDRVLALGDLHLLVLVAGSAMGGLLLTAWMFWPLRHLPSDPQVARFIEERCPELEDRLVSAAELACGGQEPGPLHGLMVADAAVHVRAIDLGRVLSRRQVWRASALALAGGAVLGSALYVGVEPAGRAIRTLWLYAVPSTVRIEVSPGDVKVVSGQPVRVRARLYGVVGTPGRTPTTLRFNSGAGWQAVDMQSGGDAYEFEFRRVTTMLQYRVTAGSASSPEFTITPLHPPRVIRVDVEYRYPSFTGLPRRLEIDGGDIYAPVGTQVRLLVHASKPITSAAMVMADGRRVGLASAGAAAAEGRLKVVGDGSYRVALLDPDGLGNPGETEYFIRITDDRPPDVRILRPGGDRQITPLEEITVEARADDDYGIERLELVYAVRGQQERAIRLRGVAAATTVSGSHTLYAEELEVRPGDFVAYYARARDIGHGRRSSEARSDIFFLEVKGFGEEFVAAQSQAAVPAPGGGSALDDLVTAQKEIIVATWKLERRAAGGRSDADIRAVARAQGEVKARAAQARALTWAFGQESRRRPRSGPAPPAPAADPMTRAVDAMGRAEAALTALKTRAALPHEMEALNELLRAQAEIRRRQVAQQSGSGSGGSGRPGEDLSGLFDRELQRQQQTNYETPRGVEERGETSESDALRRVRELAQRQDELNRRQHDLAGLQAQLTPEDLQRQLERLTREQSELRRQAEELTREVARQRQQQREGSQGGLESEGERLEDISEQMRGAASDLRRQDLGGAGEWSDRALGQLRDLERRLGAAQPDERRRALSDLQVEARQLAEAQRRVASDAGELEGGDADRDARRRMAGETERLAERVDKLQRGLASLAPGATGDEHAALAEALRELKQQQVGQRLRETAGALRDAAGDRAAKPQMPSLAENERQLQRALESVAEKLGAAASGENAEARKLAEELSRARELRERLAQIERRLEELARAGDQSLAAGQDEQQSRQEAAGSSQGSQAGSQVPQQSQDKARGGPGADAAGRDREAAGLRDEYRRELRRTQDLLDELRREHPALDQHLASGEGRDPSRSAPGTEAFKQDYEAWEALRRDVGLALERFEASRSQQLVEQVLRDRLNAGADERMPEEYRELVERYYQSLAAGKRP